MSSSSTVRQMVSPWISFGTSSRIEIVNAPSRLDGVVVGVAEIDERAKIDLVDVENRADGLRIIVVDQIGVPVGEREIVAARGRVLADEARRILIERRVVIDLVEQAEVKMAVREKLELENGPVVVRRRPEKLESVVRVGVDDRILEKMALRLQADGFEIGKLRAIGREGERAVVLNASTASAPTRTRPERSPDTVAGPGRLSPGLPVKEPSPLPSFGLVPCERRCRYRSRRR